MPLTKDDIDAVSMRLQVNGELTFSVLLTRGGLTQRLGSSDAVDKAAILIKGRTDECFEGFMATLPEGLLEGGGELEDGGRDGPRHDWRFEFGGGIESLAYDVAYHQGSASLPDEFADMVVQAERLTHSWWLAGIAEETGRPLPTPAAAPPAPAAKSARASAPKPRSAPTRGKTMGATAAVRSRGGPGVPLTRERLALVVLLDLLALTIPWSFLQWMFGVGGERAGPPGAGLVLFAILEFVLLQIARRSPGYWLLGVSALLGGKPQVDSARLTRESPGMLAAGIGFCAVGVGGITSWAAYHTPIPYFGLGLPVWLSLQLTLLGSVALVVAGVRILRLDLRGVWLGGGIAALLLLSGLVGWSEWGTFVDAVIADRSASSGRRVGEGLIGGLARTVVPILIVAVPAVLVAGAAEAWRRLGRREISQAAAARTAS